MTFVNEYAKIKNITALSGSVIVENVNISREGLAMIMLEDQIIKIQNKMMLRRKVMKELEAAQAEDQRALNSFAAAVNELKQTSRY